MCNVDTYISVYPLQLRHLLCYQIPDSQIYIKPIITIPCCIETPQNTDNWSNPLIVAMLSKKENSEAIRYAHFKAMNNQDSPIIRSIQC